MLRRRERSFKTRLSREMRLSRRKIYIGTKNPVPITHKQAGSFLVQDVIDKLQYRPQIFECDGFALALAGQAKIWFAEKYGIYPAFGIVWTNKTFDKEAHAFNFYVSPSFRITYIEPQTDLQIYPGGRKTFILI